MHNLSQMVSDYSNDSFIFPFEKNFDVHATRKWMEKHWHHAFYYSALYMLIIFSGQRYMKNKKPFQLRVPLSIWNSILALFSILGTWRTMPEFKYTLSEYGFHHSVCSNAHTPYVGFWVWAFVFSKLPELCDTVFIVLRKQKLVFLHWYHHVSVFLFCWYSYQQYFASGRWFVFMNYSVHSIMYCYFALRSLQVKIPRGIAAFITTAQITQMILGLFVSCWAYVAKSRGEECHINERTAELALAMYLSYFILFAKLFYDLYLAPSKNSPVAKKEN